MEILSRAEEYYSWILFLVIGCVLVLIVYLYRAQIMMEIVRGRRADSR